VAGAGGLANEIRAGLEDQVAASLVTKREPKNPLDDVWFGKPIRQHVREFGAVFGTIFMGICAVKLYKGQALNSCAVWFALGAVTALLGYLVPSALLPLWRGWMKLAHYLSIVMTTVILGLAWMIGFIPMAFLMKVFRVKSMDLSYKADVSTYWATRDSKYDDFKRLEQQY
jgi:hypothetical protein